MSREAIRRLIVALDFDRLSPAYKIAEPLAGFAGMFKIGSQLFTAEGPRALEKLARLGPHIFLDLKFHDIPHTVAGAVAAAAGLPGVRLVNVHALGGLEMMREAARALAGNKGRGARPKVLGVTLLTSLDAAAMRQAGIAGQLAVRALKLAQLARQAGLDGVVAAADEAAAIRRKCGKSFLIVVPGVRPASQRFPRSRDDQARVATPAEAIHAGADYIVVGRPITAARDPSAAAAAILEEISRARRQRV